ncbi:EF-P 5-aminopentanol modification-associated protein YfmF [Alicyclobacillus kakegawensis]|uniref:EF-P 5-aminopentanol modification-associated protein YfmF n=1 Tax=Alicyclobacillus kakegawensis TaxID=392012 RepID=UPI0009F86601|nr:pitrilysin family protein [Alicyclobacillus kakegawensis]
MTSFASFDDGRCSVHILRTAQFHTRHIHVKMTRPMRREQVTATALLPYLWMEGTGEHPSALELTRRSEALFGTVLQTAIGKRADRHVVEVYAGMPESAAEPDTLYKEVLELVWQVILNPATEGGVFPAGHVERQRSLHQKRIASVLDDKIQYAYERCLEEVSRDGPEALPRFGFVDDLETCTPTRLWQVYEDFLREARVHVYLVGPFADAKAEAERVLRLLHKAFPGAPDTFSPVHPLSPQGADERRVVEEQAVMQGKLNLGLRTGMAYADASYPALLVANGILGGFPHSKLFRNVREKNSLAYYASSRLDALTGVVSIQTGIEVSRYEQALAIIREQIEDLRNGRVDEQELEYTKLGLRNQYRVMLDQPMTMADLHFTGVLAGHPRPIEQLLHEIEQVSREQVIQAAESWQVDTVYFLKGRVQASA